MSASSHTDSQLERLALFVAAFIRILLRRLRALRNRRSLKAQALVELSDAIDNMGYATVGIAEANMTYRQAQRAYAFAVRRPAPRDQTPSQPRRAVWLSTDGGLSWHIVPPTDPRSRSLRPAKAGRPVALLSPSLLVPPDGVDPRLN